MVGIRRDHARADALVHRADETVSGAYGAYETAWLSVVRPAAEGNT